MQHGPDHQLLRSRAKIHKGLIEIGLNEEGACNSGALTFALL